MPDDGGPPAFTGYALPYYTRNGADTEYLFSNPSAVTVTGKLVAFGPKCQPVGEPVAIKVGPHCTQSVRMRAIQPDHAGHVVVTAQKPLVATILYVREDLAVVGNAIAGPDAGTVSTTAKRATYGFGYRTLPLGPDTLDATLYVSNPATAPLAGLLNVYDQKCQRLEPVKFSVRPGCTRELPLPAGHFGYGQVRVGGPAVLNLLHFAKSAGGLTGAELLGDAQRVQEPPPLGSGLLIDYTHGCRGAASGDTGPWEAAIVAAGNTVDHLLTPPITAAALQPYRALAIIMPRTGYTSAETQAISDFVQAGGGLLIAQDYGVEPGLGGPMPWSWPVRSVLGIFGLIDDNNIALDALHCDSGIPGNVVFDAQRSFNAHPVVAGLKSVSVSATCTFSTAAGWSTVIKTDTDSTPADQPVLVEQAFGAGRVLVFGDSNTFSQYEFAKYDNTTFGVRCAERVLFKI